MRQGLMNDWKYAGACLANGDSDEQVDFLRAFVKECLSWGTRYQVELQLANVNHGLTSEERKVLSMIGYKGEQ